MEDVKKRKEIPQEATWALEDLYEDLSKWQEDLEKVRKETQKIQTYKGTLKESAERLLEVLGLYSDMNLTFEKAYVYANQLLHQDMADASSQKCSGEVQVLMNQVNASAAFLEPEILRIPDEKWKEYLQNPRFGAYKRFLEEILRTREHSLSEEKEELLARVGELGRAPSNIYGMFNNADITFRPVVDEKGEEHPLTQERYVHYLENPDRQIRKQAFEHLYDGYKGFVNTIAAIFDANVRQAAFFAKERRYTSSLEAALDGGNIPVSVYTNLVRAVEEHLQPMYRYLKLRKRLLGVDELHMYDVYVPMVEEVCMKFSFEEAKTMVKEGLSVLGEEYTGLLEKGFQERWIDIYENEGKRSGAYSWGAYGTHPYVLLNYQGNLNHVFTLAHEMGHALHSWYSDHNQNYLNAGYRIFVAEVASTCNEALLIHDLMKKTTDKKEKAYLINYFLEQFRTTLYRQTMFAHFEQEMHQKVEEGGTLTAETLCNAYYGLNQKYYGEEMISDEQIRYEWARIPHFYTPFYVYQYATGFSAAIAISSKILAGEEGIVEKYKSFLSGGCSMDPIDLLKLCGVDMTSQKPVEEALNVFEQYVEELENVIYQYVPTCN